MREIKFRAWNDVAKVMYPSNIPGLLIHFDGELNGLDENGMLEGTDNTRQHHLMQYTGLKDKNGKDIYEGDIVRVHEGEDFIWTEQVIENSGGYWVDENYLGAIHSFCEVIGNIYEHNHLLEEQQNGIK